jgi:hypothetical protein
MFRTEKIDRRICPRHQVVVVKPATSIPADWALVPTEEELLAADRARNAFKADQRFFAMPDQFALELELQRSRGAL